MKMIDVFCLPLNTKPGGVMPFVNDVDGCTVFVADGEHAKAAAHAINCHDALVAALEAAIECGMVPKSSAREGGVVRYSLQSQVADQIRDALQLARGE